jgi:ABC-type Fe3+/spermidine/putrescine transport system ATPase subunit
MSPSLRTIEAAPAQGNVADAGRLVVIEQVSKRFGASFAVHPLDLDIRKGEFLAILGPSGCGKTTLLRIIGGFMAPTAGRITIGGVDVTRLPPEHRPTNMVFQGYGLFPHMTVAQNIGYGLRIAGVATDELTARVQEAKELVQLQQFGDRAVTELSGGQQQRVALARALIMRPQVLLLDEPLGALDLQLRKAMQEELRRIHAATQGTFVFVTHDQEEAMSLATRICVMNEGRIIQDDVPEVIYNSPTTSFVSTFIGDANTLRGVRDDSTVRLDVGCEFRSEGIAGGVLSVVRPEKMLIAMSGETGRLAGCDLVVEGRLADAVFIGPYVKYKVLLRGGATINVHSADGELRRGLPRGSDVLVGWQARDQQVIADH